MPNGFHRSFRLFAVAAFIAWGGVGAGAETPSWRARDVIDGLGVQTHLRYVHTAYGDIDKVLGDLKYLGIRSVRDSPTLTPDLKARYERLAAAGIGFRFTVRGDIAQTLTSLADFQRKYPGAVLAIEGPNEVGHSAMTFEGATGVAAGTAYHAALYDAVKADPILRAVPVFALDDIAVSSDKADFGNTHPYPREGNQPRARLSMAFESERRKVADRPVVFTESGYFTKLGHVAWGGVDEPTQAILTVNLVLDALTLGVRHTSLYELLDEDGPDHPSFETHFGLFRADHQPKPAATALRNMIALLSEPGSASKTVVPRPFAYTTTNLPKTARTLLIQKADGTAIIALWNEVRFWDPKEERANPSPISDVSIAFDHLMSGARLYDPLQSEEPIATYARADAVKIPLGVHAVFLVIKQAP